MDRSMDGNHPGKTHNLTDLESRSDWPACHPHDRPYSQAAPKPAAESIDLAEAATLW